MTSRRPGILGGVFLALWPALAGTAQPPLDAPGADDRILVVAPHPDDESLCCAGYVRRALSGGAEVAIVWLTAGDAFELDALAVEHHLRLKGPGMRRLGEMRLREALEAGRRLGVPRDNLFVLGYPDRGLAALAGNFMDKPWRSSYTGASVVPYSGARSPGKASTGSNLLAELAALVGSFRPTQVLVSAPEDRHPDHAAAATFAQRALAGSGSAAQLRYYVIHAGRGWPRPRGLHQDLALSPAPTASTRRWYSFELQAQEIAAKRDALAAHRTQREVMRPFLDAFVRRNELFAQ